MAVPMMFLNGQHFGQGRTSVEEILAKLDTNARACGC
jgi:alkyl hydroperoxide reductase subunit F